MPQTQGDDDLPVAAPNTPVKPGFMQACWRLWIRQPLIAKFLALLMLCVVTIIANTTLTAHHWIFSVQAQTRVVEIQTSTDNETKWRIDGAIICVRGHPTLPKKKFAPIK